MEDALGSRAFPTDDEIDDALVAEAARSDPTAFGELYERYYRRVYRYVYHRIGSVPDAEDITALVFMKALEGLSSYRPGRSGFAPWIFRITRNAVVDHYRKGRTHMSLEDSAHQAFQGDPLASALGSEEATELRSHVQHLSPDQREVVLLRYAADLTFAEIAVTLKKQEPAVRMLLHRGLRRLKTVMDDA